MPLPTHHQDIEHMLDDIFASKGLVPDLQPSQRKQAKDLATKIRRILGENPFTTRKQLIEATGKSRNQINHVLRTRGLKTRRENAPATKQDVIDANQLWPSLTARELSELLSCSPEYIRATAQRYMINIPGVRQ